MGNQFPDSLMNTILRSSSRMLTQTRFPCRQIVFTEQLPVWHQRSISILKQPAACVRYLMLKHAGNG